MSDITPAEAKAVAKLFQHLNDKNPIRVLTDCYQELPTEELDRKYPNLERNIETFRDKLNLVRGGHELDEEEMVFQYDRERVPSFQQYENPEQYELTNLGAIICEPLLQIMEYATLLDDELQRFLNRTPYWDYYIDDIMILKDSTIEIESLGNRGIAWRRYDELLINATHVHEILPWPPGGNTFQQRIRDGELSAEVIHTERLYEHPEYDTTIVEQFQRDYDVDYYTHTAEFPFLLGIVESGNELTGVIWSWGVDEHDQYGALLTNENPEFLEWANGLFDSVRDHESTTPETDHE